MRPGTLERRSRQFVVIAVLVLTLCPALAGAQGLVATRDRHLDLAVGQSIFLHFQRMVKVQVVEPEVLDVIVASLNDLSVYGKTAGDTVLYVWDRTGIHQIDVHVMARTSAEALIDSLRGALGSRLTYTAAGEKTIVVEGQLPAAEAQRARNIIAAAAGEGVVIVDLIRVEGDAGVGAATLMAEQLNKILGDGDIEYLIWGGNTLIVQGGIGDRVELAQAHKLLAALSSDQVKIIDMLEYREAAARPPVELIARALGEKFRVWQVAGRTVAVEGTVADDQTLADLNKILAAFSDQATIVNLVRVGKPDINSAMSALQQLVGARIVVRPLDGNTLVIEGTVPSADELTRLRDIVASYPVGYKLVDLLRVALPEKRQVQVQVQVVDINRTALSRLGINWGQLTTSGTSISFQDQPWLIQMLGSVLGGSTALGNALPIGAQLDLLRQNNMARVLSEPNLLVDEGDKARIQLGGEIPIPVAQTGTGGGGGAISVEWKPFGVLLEIEPTILESGDRINLKVSPEVSSLDFANAITIGGFVLPALRQRKASTVVTMRNGDTLVLGGLIANEQSRNFRKIPLLGDLPIIGQLFRHREFQENESELVIVVTPSIWTEPPPIPACVEPRPAPGTSQ
jgi:Flp pilus assembly secretin CpaC